jgi:hypothetical protein
MTGQLEFNSRAELCRQLAELEPANRILWMAEAENWSRLSQDKFRQEKFRKDKFRDQAGERADSGIGAGLLGRSARLLCILA